MQVAETSCNLVLLHSIFCGLIKMYWLKFRQYALAFILLLCSTQAFPACWDKRAPPGSESRSFMLAMGANTGKVKMADADAEAFADILGNQFKIPEEHICKLTAVNEEQFKSSLEDLKDLTMPKDRVFIYFSGHGIQIKDASGKYTDRDCMDEAFVTVDGPDTPVTDDFFVDTVNEMQAEKIYIFLDVCFAGGMVRGEENKCSGMRSKIHPDSDKVDIEQELPRACPLNESLKNLKGILYAATGELADAWEIKGEGGYFTRTFIKNFKKYGGTGKVPAAALLDAVFQMTRVEMRSAERENCRQIPKRIQKKIDHDV